jgi:hypothetical protein
MLAKFDPARNVARATNLIYMLLMHQIIGLIESYLNLFFISLV